MTLTPTGAALRLGITEEEVCEYLKISDDTLTEMIDEGTLTCDDDLLLKRDIRAFADEATTSINRATRRLGITAEETKTYCDCGTLEVLGNGKIKISTIEALKRALTATPLTKPPQQEEPPQNPTPTLEHALKEMLDSKDNKGVDELTADQQKAIINIMLHNARLEGQLSVYEGLEKFERRAG